MTVLDWALLMLWLGVALSGFWKGAVRIVFGLGGVAFGVWLAIVAGGATTAWCARPLGQGWVAVVVGYGLPFLLGVGACVLAGWGVEQTLRALHLGWLDRLAGGALAAAVFVVVLALVLATAARMSPAWAEQCNRSLLASHLVALVYFLPEEGVDSPAATSAENRQEGSAAPDATGR